MSSAPPQQDTIAITVELLPEPNGACRHPRTRVALPRAEWDDMDDDERDDWALEAMLELGKFRVNWYL